MVLLGRIWSTRIQLNGFGTSLWNRARWPRCTGTTLTTPLSLSSLPSWRSSERMAPGCLTSGQRAPKLSRSRLEEISRIEKSAQHSKNYCRGSFWNQYQEAYHGLCQGLPSRYSIVFSFSKIVFSGSTLHEILVPLTTTRFSLKVKVCHVMWFEIRSDINRNQFQEIFTVGTEQ